MELWTEYEGRTIDGAFPLKKLLLPEGRSAFFSTSNGKGEPTVIRLIESHFDEEEILARWRGVEVLRHPHLLKLEQYGQLQLDGTTVIYALMEPVDANLAEVVSGQRLTVPECRQLAASLASAIDVLHVNGFVHEHVEPANIFALGDVVKLRSDCIREAPEGEEGLEIKKRDVHDLAVVLLQALTQEKTLEDAARELPLPSPFEHIVRKGMSGEWGVAEITAALQIVKRPSSSAPAVAATASRVSADNVVTPAASPVASPRTVMSEPKAADAKIPAAHLPVPIKDWAHGSIRGTKLIVPATLIAVLALFVGWHFLQNRPAKNNTSKQAASAPAATLPSAGAGSSNSAGAQSAAAIATNPHSAPGAVATATHAQWRVVAYTYNHQDQAEKKSATIAQTHPELRPEVFTPNGHTPYLVTVGGAMNRDEALSFAQKSRNMGLPRDTYAQNYSGKAH